MTFIAGGNKKCRALGQDCRAVSEVMGAVLMIAIVVLAFSAVALTVFSDEGSMDPPHTPHTNLQESIDRSKDTIQIFHSGGEPIDLEDIKIILNVDGQHVEFNMSEFQVLDPEGKNSSDTVLSLRDCIVIDTSSKVEITDADAIDLYFVHTASGQAIQKTILWRDFGDLPDWITPYPYGSVYDSYTGKWLDQELVDKTGDGQFTVNDFPQKQYIYENFTFGSLDDLYIPENTLFSKVLLKIVYRIHDQSAKLEMEINNGSPAVTFNLTKKGDVSLDYGEFVEKEFDITPYVKNATDLENLVVKISTTPNAANQADKEGWIDFIGIHLEY
ncbi:MULTISPECIES: type IV pilin N-terminal domain-containing protein [unclassified Methanosarcina]|uniref:type IV pilin N-terminal domain-containing protein n=1 Tax=unclassified Methanosarcina TaxID=2644672 RepID=UPI000A62DCC0|nr:MULTISPECIES: type IV pilin N-terminal domain-containing protein [unclassified Methanosarcina]